jgi:HAD superfamily hydrolase (TIGR01509 family)
MHIYLDDGGVMNDNRPRGEQWRRLLGEFFPPRLGGTPAGWAEANRAVFGRLFEESAWLARVEAHADYAAFDRSYMLDWLRGMCAHLGLSAPADDDACYQLANAACRYVTERVRTAYPGAVEAIRQLHAAGHTLYTASGERSLELDGYLTGMGVRECFRRLYGPDLVNIAKERPEYFPAVFADAGVDPADCLVVDDRPHYVARAARAGARVVYVRPADGDYGDAPEAIGTIGALAELPALLARPG